MKTPAILISILFAVAATAQSTDSLKARQIRLAVLAAPAELREGASVYAVNDRGVYEVVKKGTNGMICLADDPRQPGFNVACYQQELEPFMQRGRELKLQGKSAKEIFDIREAEVKAGKLAMNKQPSTLYSYTAKAQDYDSIAGKVSNGYLRYVVYIPYATSQTTGLPLKPDVPGMPWIMDPGTHRAHIMINPEPPATAAKP